MYEPADDVVTSAGYLLMKAGVHIGADIEAGLRQLDLTGRDFLVLTFVGSEPLSQQELSSRLALDPTLVVGLVDGLEERGLVARNRDPADRRRYILTLTDDGRRRAADAKEAMMELEAASLAGLSPAERSELSRMLLTVLRPRLPWLPTE